MTKIELISKYGIEWYNEHILKYKQNYYNNNKEKCLIYGKQYREENKDKMLENQKQWYKDNKEKVLEYHRQYQKESQVGRANYLLQSYKQKDKKYNRGECTLTTDWIVKNIFTSKCVFCGESDWHKLGCDRIDNDKPHTEDNVQCCCGECNVKKHTYTNEEFINNN